MIELFNTFITMEAFYQKNQGKVIKEKELLFLSRTHMQLNFWFWYIGRNDEDFWPKGV